FDKIKNNDFKYVFHGNAPFPDTPYLVFGHTDWMEEMYRTAVTKNYDISASGSSDKTNYYASLGIVDEGSMLKYGNNSSLTYYLRLKYEYKFNEVIKVGANLAMRNQNWVEPSNYSFIENLISVKHTQDHAYTPEGRYMNWGGYQNPIGWAREAGDAKRVYYNIQPQLYAEITPTDNLNIRVNVAKNAYFDRSRWLNKQFQHYFWDESPSFPNIQPNQTQVGDSKSINQSFTGNAQATYKYSFNNKHHLRALAGFSHEEFSFDKTTSYRNNLVYTELYTLNMGDSKEQFNSDAQSAYSLRSTFGNLSYSFKDRYNVEGTARYDGSSRFAEGYKWKPFFGAGVSWNVTNEEFIKKLNLKPLDNLKIRASWGQLGNQNSIGLYDFVSRVNITQSNLLMGDPSATSLLQIATLSGFPSLTRTWEIADKKNIGLDIDMFGNRLNGVFNYFITENKNMFYQEEFPQVLGTSAPSINGAHVRTKGWDASLKWTDKLGDAFFYHTGFGIADAKTKVISLSDSRITRYGYNGFLEGYPVGTVFGYEYDGLIKDAADLAAYNASFTAGIPKRLRPGDAKFKDLDKDGILEATPYKVDANGKPTDDSGDLVDLGDLERHYEYFFNLGFNWKGFDFEVLMVGVGKWLRFDQNPGNNAWPWVQPLEHIYGNCWTPTNTNAKYPAYSIIISDFNPDINANNYRLSDAPYMRNNVPYLAVKNIKLGYTIPQSISRRLRIDRLYFYVNVADAGYLISRVPKSYSPEQPFYSSLTPYPRTFSVGLNLNF
ncbi:MAG: SusC/RagA family TonB-linked outer membrane protein, partial [Bacteroidales bacterium]